jgi:plastocyanin
MRTRGMMYYHYPPVISSFPFPHFINYRAMTPQMAAMPTNNSYPMTYYYPMMYNPMMAYNMSPSMQSYGTGQAYLTSPPLNSTGTYGQVSTGYGGTGQPAPTRTTDVDLQDNYFEPVVMQIAPGTAIRWTNRGSHRHTVTSAFGLFDSGEMKGGVTYTYTFQQPGIYDYYCRVHQKEMQGRVIVQ